MPTLLVHLESEPVISWLWRSKQKSALPAHRFVNGATLQPFPVKAGRSLWLARCRSGPGRRFHADPGAVQAPHSGGFFCSGDRLPLGHYYPRPGDVLICDDSTGFIAPEMVKHRPVVVVSGRQRHSRRLCTVVPLSTTDPHPVEAWHYLLPLAIPGWASAECWSKCDMLATVSFDRLDKPHTKTRSGRCYHTVRLTPERLTGVRQAVLAYLHF